MCDCSVLPGVHSAPGTGGDLRVSLSSLLLRYHTSLFSTSARSRQPLMSEAAFAVLLLYCHCGRKNLIAFSWDLMYFNLHWYSCHMLQPGAPGALLLDEHCGLTAPGSHRPLCCCSAVLSDLSSCPIGLGKFSLWLFNVLRWLMVLSCIVYFWILNRGEVAEGSENCIGLSEGTF